MTVFENVRALVALSVFLVGVFCQSCSSHAPSQSEPAPSELADTIICGYFPVVDREGNEVQQPEYYVLSAMNRKLEHHPGFAAAIGMSSVLTCDEARDFYDAYLDFTERYPDVDLSVPLGSLPVPRDIPTAGEPLDPDEPSDPEGLYKIVNGQSSSLNPVVSIHFEIRRTTSYYDNSGTFEPGRHGQCTGTFIAKNWVLTAAHCLEKLALQHAPSTSPEAARWITSADWVIRWQRGLDSQGVLTSRPYEEKFRAVSLPSPNFLGVTNGKRATGKLPANVSFRSSLHDVALLYIRPHESDHLLPNGAHFPETTLFVSTVPPDLANWTMVDYGYGGTGEFEGGSSTVQTRAPMPKAPILKSTGLNLFIQNPGAGYNLASVCQGDSGGPVVRETPSGQSIVAINSAFTNSTATFCALGPNIRVNWARVDIEKEFIQNAIRELSGNAKFECLPRPDGPGSPTSSMMQCWGRPCFWHCDCGSDAFYCSNPAVDAKRRTSCDNCFDQNHNKLGNCDCVLGQCLPKPDPLMNTSGSECPGRPPP